MRDKGIEGDEGAAMRDLRLKTEEKGGVKREGERGEGEGRKGEWGVRYKEVMEHIRTPKQL